MLEYLVNAVIEGRRAGRGTPRSPRGAVMLLRRSVTRFRSLLSVWRSPNPLPLHELDQRRLASPERGVVQLEIACLLFGRKGLNDRTFHHKTP